MVHHEFIYKVKMLPLPEHFYFWTSIFELEKTLNILKCLQVFS